MQKVAEKVYCSKPLKLFVSYIEIINKDNARVKSITVWIKGERKFITFYAIDGWEHADSFPKWGFKEKRLHLNKLIIDFSKDKGKE